MNSNIAAHYLEEARRQLRGYKRLAEGAMAQLEDPDLFVIIDAEANSIAILVKHMAGNMRSRFTGFLTTDGEKPNRFRDQEFEPIAETTKAGVMKLWEEGWECVFAALKSLTPEDVSTDCNHSRRAAYRVASHQPSNRSLCIPFGTDRFSGQALAFQRMEVAEHPAGRVGAFQNSRAEV